MKLCCGYWNRQFIQISSYLPSIWVSGLRLLWLSIGLKLKYGASSIWDGVLGPVSTLMTFPVKDCKETERGRASFWLSSPALYEKQHYHFARKILQEMVSLNLTSSWHLSCNLLEVANKLFETYIPPLYTSVSKLAGETNSCFDEHDFWLENGAREVTFFNK